MGLLVVDLFCAARRLVVGVDGDSDVYGMGNDREGQRG